MQYQAAAELERHNIQIASATEPIDRKSAAGRMTFGMLAVAAEAYSDQLRERMRDSRRAASNSTRRSKALIWATNSRALNGLVR